MKELVFLKPAGSRMEPYTTDEIIADCAGVKRGTVTRLVRRHQKDLEEFGQVGFEIRAVPYKRGTNNMKIYHFNEQQATLFITYGQNTPAVREFKKELVRQFYAMREELQKRREIRQAGKPVRRSLTDALRDSGENERLHGQGYSLYTNMLYRSVTGQNARQLQQARGAFATERHRSNVPPTSIKILPPPQAADLLTAHELERYKKCEAVVAALLDAGMDYDGIRQIVEGIA